MVHQDPVMEPVDLKRLLSDTGKKSPLILDVRDPEEYDDWRIEGSLNVPMSDLVSHDSLRKLPKDRKIVTICAHGIRSARAAQLLRESGYDALHLRDGLTGWNRVYDIAQLTDDDSAFKLVQIRRLGKGCISYMVIDGGEAAVIDPTVHIHEFINLAKDKHAKIEHVVDTHLHADHVSGARALAHATEATLHFNPLEEYLDKGFSSLRDGGRIKLGKTTIKVIHTPGHTRGSTSFLIKGNCLVTGDTLFVEGLARPDLHGQAEAFARDLYHTYQSVLGNFSGEISVLPAHYSTGVKLEFKKPYLATVAELRRRFRVMQANQREFIKYVLSNIPPKPPSYEKILEINRTGKPYDQGEVSELEEGPNRCALPA